MAQGRVFLSTNGLPNTISYLQDCREKSSCSTTLSEKQLDSSDNDVIFESPDGGQTVYARRGGQTSRTLITSAPTLAQENQLWHEIRSAAKQNPILQDLLDQARIYYQLTNSDTD